MKVFVTTIADEEWSREVLARFHSLAACDRLQNHSLAQSAESADVILFVDLHQFPSDWGLRALQNHPLARKYEKKVMVYDERDRSFIVFPGIFVSVDKSSFEIERQRSYSYYHLKNELMVPSSAEPDLLFSFQGRDCHPVRGAVLKLEHPRALVEDTSQLDFFDFSQHAETEEYKTLVRDQKKRYQEIVGRSKFVLCPRGTGTSSFRLFETMAAGRVPIIISDEWVASHGPEWELCSVRVAENEVDQIPALLESREEQWNEMARQAQQTFRDWFAQDVLFDRFASQCEDLLKNGELGRRPHLALQKTYVHLGRNYYIGRLKGQLRKIKNTALKK